MELGLGWGPRGSEMEEEVCPGLRRRGCGVKWVRGKGGKGQIVSGGEFQPCPASSPCL